MNALLIGVVLALAVSVFARLVGLDRDRAFYPTVLAVVASYYDLFATIGGSNAALFAEVGVTALFLGAVVLGYRRNLWIVVAGLVGHGVYERWPRRRGDCDGDLIRPSAPRIWTSSGEATRRSRSALPRLAPRGGLLI